MSLASAPATPCAADGGTPGTTPATAATRARRLADALAAHPLACVLALAGAHVLARLLASAGLKWDEAEQILWTQSLALGYGPQPPLYTWLQWALVQALGPGVPALSLLKHALLALSMAFMYLAARVLLPARAAWWAAAGMLLLPQFGWHSVRDQTHTVLVTCLTCAAWWLLLRLVRRAACANAANGTNATNDTSGTNGTDGTQAAAWHAADFAWLGLACGLGMLAKYSFALVAAAMLAAALSLPLPRRALLARGGRGLALAALVAAATALPHGLWLWQHLGQATAETLEKMHIAADGRWRHMARGLASLFKALAVTLLPLALALPAVFGRAGLRAGAPEATAAPAGWAARLLWRHLALALAALLGMVVLGGVGDLRERWLLPLFCTAPLAVLAARPQLAQHPKAHRLTLLLAGVAVALVLAAWARPWFSGLRAAGASGRHGMDELNHPVAALAGRLRAHGYDGRGRIIAADHMLAGMLRTQFPRAAAASCKPWPGSTDGTAAADAAYVRGCIAQNVSQAAAIGNGWLLVMRHDELPHGLRPADWWALAHQALAQADWPPAAQPPVQTIALPFEKTRADAPPARYEFIRQPATP